MRNLKKHRDAAPFLQPVDYLKLNIPDYPKIIKHPMDLSTIDKKLNSGQYENVEQWIYDVRLVFNNCFKFNGPEATISMLCQNVESAFEKSLRQMPPNKNVSFFYYLFILYSTIACRVTRYQDLLHLMLNLTKMTLTMKDQPKKEKEESQIESSSVR